MKCSVYIAASVDGFIAKEDGDIEWLMRPEYSDASKVGLVYDDFISTIDGIVMGRNSFEKVLTLGEWLYEGVEVIVLTTRDLIIPDNLKGKVRTDAGSPQKIVKRLADEGKQHLYIDGGITIQRFLDEKLITELTITEIPILLGSGIPLFHAGKLEQQLELIEVNSSEGGTIQKRYRIRTDD